MQRIFNIDSQCLREALDGYDPQRVLIVTGKNSYAASGAETFINQSLGNHVEIKRFCDFHENPRIEDLRRGKELAHDFQPDLIIGIGGGSVLDMSKLIRFFDSHTGDLVTNLYTCIKPSIPLIAIPTTAGTGAESTQFAVVYIDGKKHSLDNAAVLPDRCVLNPSLTTSSSPYLTACSGFDALAQAIESYWSKRATPKSEKIAVEAIGLLWPTLKEVITDPTTASRENMLTGSNLAGQAINLTRTTAPHAFSYPLTSKYGYPHGHAVAIFFPAIAQFNMNHPEFPAEKRATLRKLLGIETSEKEFFTNLRTRLGLTLKKNVTYDHTLIIEGINLSRLSNNPVEITEETAIQIINESL